MAEKAQRKQNVLGGAMILVVATALVKIIGAIYKIPLTGIIGTLGRGYFASAYNIYTPIYAISMAGLPVAVSTIVSRNVALHRYRNVRQVLRVTGPLFIALGVVGTAVLFLLAKPYATSAHNALAWYSVFAIAPSVLFCCIMSIFRGYYEGMSNMFPTAISEVIEALGKLVFGLAFALWMLRYATAQIEATGAVFGVPAGEDGAIVYALAAAAAIFGVTVGTAIGALYTLLRHLLKKDGISREMLVNSPPAESNGAIVKDIVRIAVPTALSSLVLNVTNLIDAWMIQNRLGSVVATHFETIYGLYGRSIDAARILQDEVATFLYGAYDTTLDFRNLVPTIMMTLGVSAIPIISAARAQNDKLKIHNTVNTVFRTTMLVALPAGAGFIALAEPILRLLYNGTENEPGVAVAAPVLALYGVVMGIMTLSAPLTNIMQAIGRADVPAKALLSGCVIKIGLNWLLIGIPGLNIKGAVFGTSVFYLWCIFYDYRVLKKETSVSIDWSTVFFKPLIAAAACGLSAWGVYALGSRFLHFGDPAGRLNGNSVSCLLAIGAAVVIYAIIILISKTLVKDDVLMLPKGEKIAKTLEKYRLLG